MEFDEVLRNRRSVRDFEDATVEEEKLIKILDAGRLAPSAGGLQDVKFILVRDEGRKMAIARACFNQNWMFGAGALIIVCSDQELLVRKYGAHGKRSSISNAAAAIENMLLQTESLGLGSDWIDVFDDVEMKRLLMIPDRIDVVAVIPIGYYKIKPRAPFRVDLHNIVFLEQWGKKE
jgi:nitroreductase